MIGSIAEEVIKTKRRLVELEEMKEAAVSELNEKIKLSCPYKIGDIMRCNYDHMGRSFVVDRVNNSTFNVRNLESVRSKSREIEVRYWASGKMILKTGKLGKLGGFVFHSESADIPSELVGGSDSR